MPGAARDRQQRTGMFSINEIAGDWLADLGHVAHRGSVHRGGLNGGAGEVVLATVRPVPEFKIRCRSRDLTKQKVRIR